MFRFLEEKTKEELKLYQAHSIAGIKQIKKEKNDMLRRLKKSKDNEDMRRAFKEDKLKTDLIEQLKVHVKDPDISITLE